MDIFALIVIFIATFFGAMYGTLVGGASLLTIPTLIFFGLDPHVAAGTNRLGIIGLPLAGWYKFHQKKLINYRIGSLVAVFSATGAIFGAYLFLKVPDDILEYVVAAFTLLLTLVLIFNPEAGIKKAKKILTKRHYAFGMVLSLLFGVYGGFYGAGIGTLQSFLLIFLFGQTFLEAAGTRKIANLLVSIVAAIIFIQAGIIQYNLVAIIFIAAYLGSWVGAHYSDRIGNVWIKRAFITYALFVSIALFIK
jgi:uncharacterized membrane protein YfcA